MIEFFKRHPFPVRSVYRRAYLQVNPRIFPTVHVNEYPKSGGTWLCRMLRDCLEWRFDDNTYPMPGKAVVKHHRLNFKMPRTVTVVRDPRDVAVSQFHHCHDTFHADGFNKHIVKLYREKVFTPGATPAEDLAAFVEVTMREPISPSYSWGQFYSSVDLDSAILVRYEDLRSDPAAALSRLFDALNLPVEAAQIEKVVGAHDITKILAKRKDKDANHFIRKGKVGGWQDDLTPESVKQIEQDAGAFLARFGYA